MKLGLILEKIRSTFFTGVDDIEKDLGRLKSYRHHERSCPKLSSMCLVPLPREGYGNLVSWTQSKLKNLLSELNWKSELTEDRKLSELKPSEFTSELKCGYTSGMKSG
ncbi:hypothetical protein AgCh_009657 [Apium graveolens]